MVTLSPAQSYLISEGNGGRQGSRVVQMAMYVLQFCNTSVPEVSNPGVTRLRVVIVLLQGGILGPMPAVPLDNKKR